MEFAATQIYEEEDFDSIRVSQTSEKTELIQVGILHIYSTEYQIKKGSTIIGRLDTCSIQICDPTVSKKHAEIEADGDQGSTWIRDLMSANKTILNNKILKPERFYELKDGSIIMFGKVRAVYRTYRPTDDTVIPETPAPTRQNVARTIIPNTPDLSLNNSSAADDDGSVILGTQTEEEKSVFRRPLLALKRRSTSIEKKNALCDASMSESADSQTDIRLRVSVNDSSESEEVSIHDMETQMYATDRKTVASGSIQNMETQVIPTNVSECLEVNTTANKRLAKFDLRGKIVENARIDISDTRMQNYASDNEQQRAGKNRVNMTTKKSTVSVHDLETQNYIVDTGDNNTDTRDTTANKSMMLNIHDLETQSCIVTKNASTISGLATQNYIVDAGKNDIGVRKKGGDKNKTQIAHADPVERNIHDLETQILDGERTVEDIHDMETQLVPDSNTSESSNSRANKNNADKNNDTSAEAIKSGTSCENAIKLPVSRSSSAGSLNLSPSGIDEECPTSPLDQSAHLLESTALLEYFDDGIDTSTPMPRSKASSQRGNAGNTADASDNGNDNEEDNIHDQVTQRIISCKLKAFASNNSETNEENAAVKTPMRGCEISRLQSIDDNDDDDAETDAEEYLEELARKQGGSSGASNKCDEKLGNRSDRSTSADSDDVFNMPTQRSSENHPARNMSDLLVNGQRKTNKADAVVDDTAPTQKMSIEPSADIDDMTPTQLILPHEAFPKTVIDCDSKDSSSSKSNNRNNVDDTAPTRIIRANVNASGSGSRTSSDLDCGDINYETAPTQVISEVAEKRNLTRTSDRAKAIDVPSEVDLNDTLERNLNEMFDDSTMNVDSDHMSPLYSTQNLQDILQSSQCDDLFPDKSTADEKALTNNAPAAKPGEKSDRSSCNVTNSAVDKNNANEADSQNSDTYFATITTKRKRNVIRDTQEFIDSTEDITSSRRVNSSRGSKGETKNDRVAAKSNTKGGRIKKSKEKSDATTNDLVDDAVSKTASSETNEKPARKTRSVKQTNGTAAKTSGQTIQEVDSCVAGVSHAEGNLTSSLDACASKAPCSSRSEQGTQALSILYENDNDILSGLPAVKISGTLSNPPSPSASSTSTVRSVKLKRGVARGRKKNGSSKSKSLLVERNVENLNRTTKSPLLSHDNHSSNVGLKTSNANKMLQAVSDSENSDVATSYSRFKQMASRILGNQKGRLEEQDEEDAQGLSRPVVSNMKKDVRSAPDTSNTSKQNSDLEGSDNSIRTGFRTTRSNRQNNGSVQLTKETRAKDATKSTAASRRRELNMIEKSAEKEEQTNSKTHKVDRIIEEPVSRRSKRTMTARTATDGQSSNISEDVEVNSRGNSPIIGSAESPKNDKRSRKTRQVGGSKADGSTDVAMHSVTRSRRKVNDSQAVAHASDKITDASNDKDKRTQVKERETLASQTVKKVPKIVINPIIMNEEREVEMIMMGKAPSDIRDTHSLIREGSNTRILLRESKSTRSRKRANMNAITDSSSIESSASSDTSDLESVRSGSITSMKAKRGRFAKDAAPSAQKPQASESNKVFKRPARVGRSSASLTGNTVTESSTNDCSENSSQSDVPLNVRLSKSKAANAKNTMNVETHESTRRSGLSIFSVSPGISTSGLDSTFRVSTPSRARRSASSMSISSPSSARHRILFTGITEDKYNKVVKTLGGSKVDDPELCTVLVTDKVRRTYKFLCALAKGVPIVSIDWLNDSESAAQFLDWENYILKDPVAEAKFVFRLRKSLDKAKETGLLVGYTIVLTPNVAPPPTNELKDIVAACGGRTLLRPPATWPERAVIMSRVEDLENAKKYLAKAPKTVTVQSTEFILTGILRQEVNFDKYKLI